MGQAVSASGDWMQTVGQLWLVLKLTGSGTALGITSALQFAPVLVLGAWGGVVADQVDKRRLLIVTQVVKGVLAASLGAVIAPCFFVNAGSFVAVIAALALMRTSELHRSEPAARAKGQVREGFHYAMGTPDIRLPLLMMAVIGTLAYNFRVLLPLVAEQTFHGGAGLFGTLYSVMSVGSLAGALFTASRTEATSRYLVFAALAFGLVILAAAAAPTLALEAVALMGVGAASAAFTSTTQATLQIRSSPPMRGRVMALYSVVFIGSTPIGGPIIGWAAQHFGPRFGFAIGGLATVVTAMVARPAVRARRSSLDLALSRSG